MEWPLFLPPELGFVKASTTPEELIRQLPHRGDENVVIFLEHALQDETWLNKYGQWLETILQWLTGEYFEGRLENFLAQRVQSAVQEHYNSIHQHLINDIAIVVADQIFYANSILLGLSSSFFFDLLRRECKDKKRKTFELINATPALFTSTLEFMNTGRVKLIWGFLQEEVLTLLRQANEWDLGGLVLLCSLTFRKFITRMNIRDILALALHERLFNLKERCFEFLNSLHFGLLFFSTEDGFGVELGTLSDEGISFLEVFKTKITYIVVKNDLLTTDYFSSLLQQTPLLKAVDFSDSNRISENAINALRNLQSANLTRCSWLTASQLEMIIQHSPQLRSLILKGNLQLSPQSWGVLAKLPLLDTLDISHCLNIDDKQLSLIASACPFMQILLLEGCQRLTDEGMDLLSKRCLRLTHLNLARCARITDKGLAAITSSCHFLQEVDLSRCLAITDKGINQLLLLCRHLKKLNIGHCSISDQWIEMIRLSYPKVEFVL